MAKQVKAKQERVIEAVRRGLEGTTAVEFIHQSGYALTAAGIARHLRKMGGRGRIQELINDGKTNLEILKICFPKEDPVNLEFLAARQEELFVDLSSHQAESQLDFPDVPVYDTARVSLRLPADLYEAIRLAARAEGKSQNQLIIELLTKALSSLPTHPPCERER